ncbi:WD40-repeat-containing domain protein [Irpex rosettiformis]|uniref:WD40-repeat-containing domain protein n=1 Tax=Irpex rosettiformis TaxID=378272 RepID=A0ACB8TRL7_9APHY|nr:WD40-repeat-containing domain protein [Irpex rosettiformis]
MATQHTSKHAQSSCQWLATHRTALMYGIFVVAEAVLGAVNIPKGASGHLAHGFAVQVYQYQTSAVVIMYPTIVVFLIHTHTQFFLTDAYQSVDGLLGYILETSPEAERAFASDEEVCSLYWGERFANDVLASLREKRPRIVVDEHTVGTMPLDDAPMRNGIGTFHDSKGKDTTLDWPHQHLSDKPQQQRSLKTTAVSCDGKLVAVGFDDATIILWDLATGRVVSRPECHEDGRYALVFSPNGTRLACAFADMKVVVWTVIADEGEGMTDVAENDVSILEDHEPEVTKLAYSLDGSHLVLASLDGTMKNWDASSAYELLRSINNITCSSWLCITPDSTTLVATMDNLVYVWNISDGMQVATMRGHDTNIYMTAVSHDGTRVATASEDETARVWNVENGEELLTLHEHTSSVWCIDGIVSMELTTQVPCFDQLVNWHEMGSEKHLYERYMNTDHAGTIRGGKILQGVMRRQVLSLGEPSAGGCRETRGDPVEKNEEEDKERDEQGRSGLRRVMEYVKKGGIPGEHNLRT